MSFKVKKIRQKKSKVKLWQKVRDIFGGRGAWFLFFTFLISFIFLIGTALLKWGHFGEGSTRVLPSFSLLEEDEYGNTNLLLLGVAGKNEEGGNLSDSIMIVSINHKKPTVSMLSLPRDLYIDSEAGARKVNEIYAAARYKYGDQKGLAIAKQAISHFTNIEIHYGAVVNFQVFEDTVDELGGIKMFVPEDIDDPFYPADNYGYQRFVIRKGIQTLDGPTALKYARSRKTSSDYSRARRQQDLIMAIKQKAQDSDILFDTERIKSLYQVFKSNVNTDLGIKEILVLTKTASELNYDNLVSAVLNDDPLERGGFLYAPAREFYGGQFVLLPENLRDTQKFIELTLITPEVLLENAQISVLNGSGINGLAGDMATRLRKFGFHVIETGNYKQDQKPVFRSFFEVISSNSTTLTQNFIKEFLGFENRSTLEHIESDQNTNNSIVDIKVILGVTQESL